MSNNEYVNLVSELTSLIQKYKYLFEICQEAEQDLMWRYIELYKSVKISDEEKFIKLSGMQGRLLTTDQKNKEKQLIVEFEDIKEKNKEISEKIETSKKKEEKDWAKKIYKRAIRRCHPDTLKTSDIDYKTQLIKIYKEIVSSYDNREYDMLMVEAYKLMVKPEKPDIEQIDILKESCGKHMKFIKNLSESQYVKWHYFDDNLKEVFLINMMKQNGIKFVDKDKVKEIVKRKVHSRKPGQRPINNLKNRVK